MDMVNVVIFYLVTISDATNEFLPGDSKYILNWIKLNSTEKIPGSSISVPCTQTYLICGWQGMRIAMTEADFDTQLESAKMEAMKSFGDQVMLLEKFVVRPRYWMDCCCVAAVCADGDDNGDDVLSGDVAGEVCRQTQVLNGFDRIPQLLCCCCCCCSCWWWW